MTLKILQKVAAEPVNEKLEKLEQVQKKVEQMKEEEQAKIRGIREGFQNCVVVFIDLVDSTKFKIEQAGSPENWILRVRQFGDIVREYIKATGGQVVKYIGDEVMAAYTGKSQVADAISFLNYVKDMVADLTEITKTPTSVKIALDAGPVYFLKYDGHEEPDPQGTPIDRCARIAKYCQPGTTLSSFEFVSSCPHPEHWTIIGTAPMKGLGSVAIYQYGEKTFEVKEKVEITVEEKNELDAKIHGLTEVNQKISLERKTYQTTIGILEEQLRKAGEKPALETRFDEDEDSEREEAKKRIDEHLYEIRKLIGQSRVTENNYARFLFLHFSGQQEDPTVLGRNYKELIEAGYVVYDEREESLSLNEENKRNRKILGLVDVTERMLNDYVDNFGAFNEDDLFEYTFKDPEFWRKELFFIVR